MTDLYLPLDGGISHFSKALNLSLCSNKQIMPEKGSYIYFHNQIIA